MAANLKLFGILIIIMIIIIIIKFIQLIKA